MKIETNDNWDIFDKEIKRGIEVSRRTMQACIEPYIKELTLYKRALELACHYMEYEYPKKNDDIYYRKEQELEMIFLYQAKKELEEKDVTNN